VQLYLVWEGLVPAGRQITGIVVCTKVTALPSDIGVPSEIGGGVEAAAGADRAVIGA
jgi:hypothetical protein